MPEVFITKIYVEESRNVKDLEIPLSTDHRQHLIITGKNGSGKTSLLLELGRFLNSIIMGNLELLILIESEIQINQLRFRNETDPDKKNRIADQIKSFSERRKKQFGGTSISFSTLINDIHADFQKGEFLLAFFDSKRLTNLNVPQGIKKVNLKKQYNLNEKAGLEFIQYIVNLKADRSFARDDKDETTVKQIDEWFERFENRLKSIFEVDNLQLKFDRNSYNFEIVVGEKEQLNFNTLSDGYSAIISIVTELLLRMEAHAAKSYDLQGVVMIDEIETHLHVGLQKKILPFLIDFFPKIQFIVTTHSPFVLSSLSNATVCDLESKTITTDLSAYSYEVLIESYFKTDKYSEDIKNKIFEFEKLSSMSVKDPETRDKIRDLRNYFAHAPKYLSPELMVKLQQIELTLLNSK